MDAENFLQLKIGPKSKSTAKQSQLYSSPQYQMSLDPVHLEALGMHEKETMRKRAFELIRLSKNSSAEFNLNKF